MKELYLGEAGSIELREIVLPKETKANEVRVRTIYGGICGSDIRVWKGLIGHAKYPIQAGHEVVGEVVGAGAGAEEWIGKRVTAFPNTYCGLCEFCAQGKTNICESKTCFGVNLPGFFAEEFVVDQKYVVEIPADLSSEKGVLIEPLAVAVHAVRRAGIEPGQNVAVVGCGPEGLLAVTIAVYLGAEVTAIELNPVKDELIKSLGVKEILRPGETDGHQFDVVFEAAGVKAATEQAVELTKSGGKTILIGFTDRAEFQIVPIVRGEKSILGTIIYTKADFATAIRYLQDANFKVDPVVSKAFPLEQYKDAYEMAASGKYGKIVLDFQK